MNEILLKQNVGDSLMETDDNWRSLAKYNEKKSEANDVNETALSDRDIKVNGCVM